MRREARSDIVTWPQKGQSQRLHAAGARRTRMTRRSAESLLGMRSRCGRRGPPRPHLPRSWWAAGCQRGRRGRLRQRVRRARVGVVLERATWWCGVARRVAACAGWPWTPAVRRVASVGQGGAGGRVRRSGGRRRWSVVGGAM